MTGQVVKLLRLSTGDSFFPLGILNSLTALPAGADTQRPLMGIRPSPLVNPLMYDPMASDAP